MPPASDAQPAPTRLSVDGLFGGTNRVWSWLGARTRPCERHFDAQQRRDPFGCGLHLVCGVTTCLLLSGPTTLSELALVPAGIMAMVRPHWYWRTLGGLVVSKTTALWAMAVLWGLLALAWSPDRGQGLDELSNVRWSALGLMLWPLMQHRALLLAALAIGLHIGQATQLMHGLGVLIDEPSLRWNRMPGRWSGWWDPVVGGTLLVGLLGLHLPAAAWGRGGWRLAGLAGSAAAVAGIVATGTRGAWLASMGLVGLVALGWWWKSKNRLKVGGAAVALVLILGAAAAGVGVVAGGSGLSQRVESAWTEINRAIDERDFTTDTGARIGMAIWAAEAWRSAPVHGVGTGGYKQWVLQNVEGPSGQRVGVHAHAHNGLLHIAATGGLIGLVLMLLVYASAVSSAGRYEPGDGVIGYRDGPMFALLGLGLVSAFDPFHLNTQTCALFAVLVVLRLPNRPRLLADRAS